MAFLATRLGLLLTSYDAQRNWEEPAFLFSALQVQERMFENLPETRNRVVALASDRH